VVAQVPDADVAHRRSVSHVIHRADHGGR
jgi:hypothetical protein